MGVGETTLGESRLLSIALGIALVAAAFVATAGPGAAWHTDMEVVHEEQLDESAAVGVATDLEESGDLALGVTGYSPLLSAPLSGGVVAFDQDKNHVLTFAFTAHGSPDRLIVEPTPAEPEPSGDFDDGGTWETHAVGDVSLLETMDITIEVLPDLPSLDDEEPLMRVGTTSSDLEPGTHYQGAWVGTVGSSLIEVETDAAVSDVETVVGSAYVKGDPDIEDGTPNAQVQQSQTDPRVGFKVINDATVDVDAEHGVYGFWGVSDFKLVCQNDVLGGCVWGSQVYHECAVATGQDCEPSSISWETPSGQGSGSSLYSFSGTEPGQHAFTVDHKVDVYGPSMSEGGTWVSLGENYSYLTVGDFTLP